MGGTSGMQVIAKPGIGLWYYLMTFFTLSSYKPVASLYCLKGFDSWFKDSCSNTLSNLNLDYQGC